MSNLISQRLRGALLASTALLAMPAAALAEEGRPADALDLPQSSTIMIDGLNDAAQDAQRNAAARVTFEAVEIA